MLNMAEANPPIIEECDVCKRKVDIRKESILFCTDYKARCRECYTKWSGLIAS
jgi:hypothetical protein